MSNKVNKTQKYPRPIRYEACCSDGCYNLWGTPLICLDRVILSESKQDLFETSSDTSSSLDELSVLQDVTLISNPADISESSDDTEVKKLDKVSKRKIAINLPATLFTCGSVCGHGNVYRDSIKDYKKRKYYKPNGITIKPKVPPVLIKLRM